MTRKKSILSPEEFMRQRTFTSFVEWPSSESWLSIIEAVDFTAREFYTKELENIPFLPPSTHSRYNSRPQVPTKDYSKDRLVAINKKFLSSHRRSLSQATVDFICKVEHHHSPAKSISFFMLNEFLGQDLFDVYHDFLNAKWDHFYELAASFKITTFKHTEKVYSHYRFDSPFAFRTSASKKTRMALEELTKAQLLELVTKMKPVAIPTAGVEIFFTNQLKDISGDLERQISPGEASNSLFRAFAATILASNNSQLPLRAIHEQFTQVMVLIDFNRIARSTVRYTTSQIEPNKLGKLGAFLEANASEFTLAEAFFIIQSIANHRIFARTGSSEDVASLYMAFLQRKNAVELFKMVGELGQAYDNQLPTFIQWRKALESGELDFIMESGITVLLVSASDSPRAVPLEIKYRRKLFDRSAP